MVKLPLLIGVLMAMNNYNATSVATQFAAAPTAVVMTHDEQRYVDLVNQERAQRGLSQLVVDPNLIGVARGHSKEMSQKHYFSHTSPTEKLKTPLDRFLVTQKQRPKWALVGENLYYCSIVDVDRGHQALMNSPGHRANILEPRYERIGVGIYTDKNGEFFVTESFLAETE